MACCAFAAFLIAQLLFALERVRKILGLSSANSKDAVNAAVAWNLGQPIISTTNSKKRKCLLIWGGSFVVVEIVLLVGIATAWEGHHATSNDEQLISEALLSATFCRQRVPAQPASGPLNDRNTTLTTTAVTELIQ